MAMLVERKESSAPYHGRSKQGYPRQNSPPVRSTAPSKARERQKMTTSKSSGSYLGGAVSSLENGVTGAELNMMAVQKVDPCMCRILSTVPQVVLYHYGSNIWERTSTEGTLFIYNRDGHPSSGFVLLNRLSSDNLQEMVVEGSEYRVQGVFVLFRPQSDANRVYGLCFNDTASCSNAGKLLNNLSHSVSGSNCRDTSRAPDVSMNMRSHSVPTLQHTQVLSDDAGSSGQESPPSETICFTAHPLTSSHHNEQGQPDRGVSSHASSSPSSVHTTRHQKTSGDKERSGLKRSTPRTIPKLVNMNAASSPPAPSRAHSQSSSTSHHVHSQMQYSSRVTASLPKQTQNSRLAGSGAVTTTTASSGMTNTAKTVSVTPKQEPTKTPLRAATAPSHVSGSRRKQPSTFKTAAPAVNPGNRVHTSGPLQEVVPEQSLARQLFEREPPRESSSTAATTTDSGSVQLQQLFSQAPTREERRRSPTIAGSALLSIAAIRPLLLTEIEKQMSEEVPSPDKTVPFSIAPQSSTTHLSSITSHTTATTSSSSSSTAPLSAAVTGHSTSAPSSSGEDRVLLQPSSFSTTQHSQTTASHLTTRDSTATAGTGRQSSSSLAVDMTLPSFLQQNSGTSGAVMVSVDPPTPVVTSSKTVHFGRVNDGVFPDIPPIMHSPGMQAPPVSGGVVVVQQYKQREGEGSNEPYRGPHKKKGGEGVRGRRGKRSPARSGSPAEPGDTPSPQPGAPLDVTTTPSRSWSVPSNMSPVSVAVPHHPASQPHALLSPQQFSCSPDTATHTLQQTPQERDQTRLSQEHFKQALIYVIQNDDEFVRRIYHAYHHLSVTQQLH